MLLDTTNVNTTPAPTVKRWTGEELQAQFKKCEGWNDPEQWEALAMLYYSHGYLVNAKVCFERADKARGVK